MTQWNHRVWSGVRAGAELCLFPSTLTKAVWSIPVETSNQEKQFPASVPLRPQILSWLMNLHLGRMKLAGRHCKCGWKPCTYSSLWSWLLRTSNSLRSLIYWDWHGWGTGFCRSGGLCGGSVTLIQHFLFLLVLLFDFDDDYTGQEHD